MKSYLDVSDVDLFNHTEGVGKSTIVTSLIKESFVARVCFVISFIWLGDQFRGHF